MKLEKAKQELVKSFYCLDKGRDSYMYNILNGYMMARNVDIAGYFNLNDPQDLQLLVQGSFSAIKELLKVTDTPCIVFMDGNGKYTAFKTDEELLDHTLSMLDDIIPYIIKYPFDFPEKAYECCAWPYLKEAGLLE